MALQNGPLKQPPPPPTTITPPPRPTTGLVDNADGTVTDLATGKVWPSLQAYQQDYAAHSDPSANDPNKVPGLSSGSWVDQHILSGNPIAAGARAGYDLATGNPTQAAGDITNGGTFGVLGTRQQQAGAIGQVPGGFTALPGDAAQAAGAAGQAIGGAISGAGQAIGSAIGGSGAGGAPAADPNAQNDFRQRQLDYANQLQATINGTAGPSAADIQGHNAQDRATAQQFAMAQGATGANSSMAYRQALQNAAGISQQGGADAATLRAKEVQDAQTQYNGLLSGGRGADLTKYGTDVGAGNVRYAADKDFQGKEIAAVAGIGSALAMPSPTSDERAKTDVGSGDVEIADMLDKLAAKKFRYKDPSAPGTAPGKRTGVMAQDLEKSMAGNALVKDTPSGKVIDSPQAIGAVLAALASIHGRMKRIEGR